MAVSMTMRGGVDWLRELAAALHTDSFAGTFYWTDGQLLNILEESIQYEDYLIYQIDGLVKKVFSYNAPKHYWLDTTTAFFTGTALTPTFNVRKRQLTFASALTEQTSITGHFYNMYEAAAEVWDKKAGQRYDAILIKAGANQLNLQQEYQHCIQQRDYYRNKIIRRVRTRVGW